MTTANNLNDAIRAASEKYLIGPLDPIIDRLRAAGAEESEQLGMEGHALGIEWARDDARPKQLRRLSEFDADELGVMANGSNDGIANGLFREINPKHEDDPHAVRSFWEMALGDDGAERIEDEDFARGFVQGAVEVWDAVKGKL